MRDYEFEYRVTDATGPRIVKVIAWDVPRGLSGYAQVDEELRNGFLIEGATRVELRARRELAK